VRQGEPRWCVGRWRFPGEGSGQVRRLRGACPGRRGRAPGSWAGGEHRACQDQGEGDQDRRGERLAEDGRARADRHGRVDVGDDQRPGGPGFGDQLEVQHERQGGAHHGERGQCAEHPGGGHGVRPGQRRGQGAGGRGDAQAGRGHPQDVSVSELAAGDHRADRIAQRGAQHFQDRPELTAGGTRAHQQRDPAEADGQPGPPDAGQPVPVTGQLGHPDAKDRPRRDQQAAQRTGQPPLSRRQQQPRQDHLDRCERGQPWPQRAQRPQAAAAHGDRQQQHRAGENPGEHQNGHGNPAISDLDQQVGDPPDHAHHHEQDPATAAHRRAPLWWPLASIPGQVIELRFPRW
jgi:hypothetical protein